MSDAIDRQAAIVTAVRAAIDWHKLANPQYSIAYCIGEAMRAIPAADVVEVVRCKDCKHSVDYYDEGDCYCSNPKWGLMYFGGSWEFYCADAERGTDDYLRISGDR